MERQGGLPPEALPEMNAGTDPEERGDYMDIQDIKRYSDEILEAMTERDGSGRGYVCPVCGSGSGKHGTGLLPVKGKPGYYHCFAAGCPFEHGDILELIGKTYHLADTAQQIEKAGQLLHMDFTDKNQWFNKGNGSRNSGESDKNMVQNNDNLTDDKNNGFNQEILKEQAEIKAFMESAAAALPGAEKALQYLQRRGISRETAARFRLGYVSRYGDGMNTAGIIIPTGEYSYTVRSITTNDSSRKVRKKKAGDKAGIFGIGIMKNPPPLAFIVEGEFDKLAVNEAGFPAIATGGGTSKREMVEQIKAGGIPPTIFYIIPDNDRRQDGSPDYEKGIKAGQDLLAMLKAAGIRAELVDILGGNWPEQHKDCNDFLQADREAFTNFLTQQRLAMEEKELGRVSGYMQDFVKQIAGNTPPIPTGYIALDNLLEGGLHPGLIVIGAISSLGKTTFTLNVADLLAMAGKDVLFYSLEMSRFELISKIISRRTALTCLRTGETLFKAKTNLGVSDFKRWTGYSKAEKELLQTCMNDFTLHAAQNLYIREGLQDIGTEQIRRDIQKHLLLTGRRPTVIIDYLQIMKTPDIHMTDKQKTDSNVTELKRISRDYNTAIIGISSFNRDSYTQPVTMSSFKESGSVEYSSDVLLALQYQGMDYMARETEKDRTQRIRDIFKENEQNARQGKAIPIQCKILKNRSGGKGDCIFDYFPMFNLYLEHA